MCKYFFECLIFNIKLYYNQTIYRQVTENLLIWGEFGEKGYYKERDVLFITDTLCFIRYCRINIF